MNLNIAAIMFFLAAGLFYTSCGGDSAVEANADITDLPPVAVISMSPASPAPWQKVTLDGSTSFDPEGTPIKSYAWRQTGGTLTGLSGATAAVMSFYVPDTVTTLEFELVVTNDNAVASSPTLIQIPVAGKTPPPPQSAVFVSSKSGNDSAARDGSQNMPVATIGRALAIAAQNGFTNVYVMEGTYTESIAPQSGITIKGCVTSVDENGVPAFNASNANTILKTPVGKSQAILLSSVQDVRIECLAITGASVATGSMGIAINASQRIALDNLSIKTPGAAGAACRDIQATDSSEISVTDSSFQNSGKCGNATCVLADNVQGLKIVPEDDTNYFWMASNGNESYLKAIEVLNSAGVDISRVTIDSGSGQVSPGTVFTGISLEDVQSLAISDSAVSIDGADRPAGILYRCTDVAADASLTGNSISFAAYGTSATGVRIICPQPNADFEISQNRIALATPDNQTVAVRGINASSQLRPIKLSIVNNAISMPGAVADMATKTGIYLTMMGAGSTISSVHNTVLINGNGGELHAVSSDRGDVQFSTIDDILLVYGANANNAILSMPSACGASFCAKEIVADLVNANFGATNMPLAYYPDTAQFVALSVANECEQNPQPAQCQNNQVNRRGNVLKQNLQPSYFDFDAAELLAAFQVFAKDKGVGGTGVTTDIDGKSRSDGLPDIGATEY